MQPFEGIRVIDFTHVLAGPFCTYQLAVMGAEVIKIESPFEPDMMRVEGACPALGSQLRGSHFLAQGGNKKSVLVDIQTQNGRQVIRKLVETADVLVENFRSGVMARNGLDYPALKAINPALIYCSMSGFGDSGPMAGLAAYDNVIQAFSGLMAHTGNNETAPVRVGPPVLDYGTGSQAAFAVSAALFQRSRSGRGQRIDVSMLDAALMLMSNSVVDTQLTASPPKPPGNSSVSHPGYACFEAREGLIMIGAFTAKQHSTLWSVLGREEIARQMLTLGSDEISQRLQSDRNAMAAILIENTASHWEEMLNCAGVPAARVRKLDEALAEPQLASRKVLQEATGYHPQDTDIRFPVAAFSFEHDGPSVTYQAPPFGAHTDEVLSAVGYSEEQLRELRTAKVIA